MKKEVDVTHLCQMIEQILEEREKYKYEVVVKSNEVQDNEENG